MSKNNEPAFPMLEPSGVEGLYGLQYRGMTLLDWFAGQAMQAIIIGNRADVTVIGKNGAVGMATDAYIVADAMLMEREK